MDKYDPEFYFSNGDSVDFARLDKLLLQANNADNLGQVLKEILEEMLSVINELILLKMEEVGIKLPHEHQGYFQTTNYHPSGLRCDFYIPDNEKIEERFNFRGQVPIPIAFLSSSQDIYQRSIQKARNFLYKKYPDLFSDL